jgi:excisionase family DNA binding protein
VPFRYSAKETPAGKCPGMTMLLDEDEAADVLTITRRELRQLVRNGRLPVVAVPLERGELARFDQQDLARAIQRWKRPAARVDRVGETACLKGP